LSTAREISFFEKDHAINQLEGCCIDQLNRHDRPETWVVASTFPVSLETAALIVQVDYFRAWTEGPYKW